MIREFLNKKILIYGFGLEGKSSYNYLRKHLSQTIFISDKNKIEKLENTIFINEDELNLDDFDIVLKSPGIVIKEWKDNITSQSELFLKYYRDNTIGITGTKGKSTTASLIYHILKNQYKCFLVGNIGIPCFDILDSICEDSIIVFEISAHQLENIRYSPKYAILLNLYQEHLDHYGTYEKYIEAKMNIHKFQNEDDIFISPLVDCDIVINRDISVKDKYLINEYGKILIEETNLIGKHNYLNMSVAYYILNVFFGVSSDDFKKGVKTFKPLKHRLENIGTFKDITFIDDSISTIGETTINAIESLKNVTSVLIGGMDRNIDYSTLIKYLRKTDIQIICMYESGKRIYNEIKDLKNTCYCSDLKEAFNVAIKTKGMCLLSPASPSYGPFKDFNERGETFKKLVCEFNEL